MWTHKSLSEDTGSSERYFEYDLLKADLSIQFRPSASLQQSTWTWRLK